MSVNDKLTEQEFFENQVREYYSQLMKKLGLKEVNDKEFSEVYKSLCSCVRDYSRGNGFGSYNIGTFKHRINNLFDDQFVFPVYYFNSVIDEEGIRFIQPTITDNSVSKLEKFFESLDDFISVEEDGEKNTLKFQIYVDAPRLSNNKKFNGDILCAVIRNFYLKESKFNLKLSIDAENIWNVVNKPSVPVFYTVETTLETNPVPDWVKTIGEKYLVEDKLFGKPIMEGPMGVKFDN